jgi:hypothetical protein
LLRGERYPATGVQVRIGVSRFVLKPSRPKFLQALAKNWQKVREAYAPKDQTSAEHERSSRGDHSAYPIWAHAPNTPRPSVRDRSP